VLNRENVEVKADWNAWCLGGNRCGKGLTDWWLPYLLLSIRYTSYH